MAPGPGIENTVPEDLGKECALGLLDEIYRGGTVDSAFQWLVILWMALGQKDVSTCTVSIFFVLFLFLFTFLITMCEFSITDRTIIRLYNQLLTTFERVLWMYF